MTAATPVKKRAINVSIDPQIAAEAKAAGLNLSRLLDAAVRAELKTRREAQWREENREAIEDSNRYFAEHGNALDKFRVW